VNNLYWGLLSYLNILEARWAPPGVFGLCLNETAQAMYLPEDGENRDQRLDCISSPGKTGNSPKTQIGQRANDAYISEMDPA
jgi:hypothetical protein